MVECTVPDELTVSIPPRRGLVLIVHACTHCVENQTPLLRDKGSECTLLAIIYLLPLGRGLQGGCDCQVGDLWLGMEEEVTSFSLVSPGHCPAQGCGFMCSLYLSCSQYPLHRCNL